MLVTEEGFLEENLVARDYVRAPVKKKKKQTLLSTLVTGGDVFYSFVKFSFSL